MTGRPRRWIRDARRPPAATLALVIVVWWVFIGGAVALTMPAAARSAPNDGRTLTAGQQAYIYQPGIPHWPIPVSRLAYDQFQQGMRTSDEAMIDDAFTGSSWIDVTSGQAVRIVLIEGDAIQVELLDGSYAGQFGWLQWRQLTLTP